MNELSIIHKDGVDVIDSREVAEAIGKQHAHLMRDIHNSTLRSLKKLLSANLRSVKAPANPTSANLRWLENLLNPILD